MSEHVEAYQFYFQCDPGYKINEVHELITKGEFSVEREFIPSEVEYLSNLSPQNCWYLESSQCLPNHVIAIVLRLKDEAIEVE
jgi:hypothetical protein